MAFVCLLTMFRCLFSIVSESFSGFLNVKAIQGIIFYKENVLSRGLLRDCHNFGDLRFQLYSEYHCRVQRRGWALGWDTGAAILDNTEQSRPRRRRTARGKQSGKLYLYQFVNIAVINHCSREVLSQIHRNPTSRFHPEYC